MKIFSLSTVSALLLLTSTLPVVAMEDLEEITKLQSIRRFPINQEGHAINQQDYAISGQQVKHLAAHPNANSPAGLTGLADNEIYLEFGVTTANIIGYQAIPDNALYFAHWDGVNEWRISGHIPNSLK